MYNEPELTSQELLGILVGIVLLGLVGVIGFIVFGFVFVLYAPIWAPLFLFFILLVRPKTQKERTETRRSIILVSAILLVSLCMWVYVIVSNINRYAVQVAPICDVIQVKLSPDGTVVIHNKSKYTIERLVLWVLPLESVDLNSERGLFGRINPGQTATYTYSSPPKMLGVMHIQGSLGRDWVEGPCFYRQ